jgi:uncharacterized protein (TIGR03437 family)
MKSKITFLALLLGACAWQSSAQPALESSGDQLLSGTYYMRQVLFYYSIETGTLTETVNIQGTIDFTGSGTYYFSGSTLVSTDNPPKPATFTSTGSYVISASGEGYISSIDHELSGNRIVGLVSQGIFIGNTGGGNGLSDFFVAAPVGSTMATNATLTGAYSVAYIDPTFPGDALFTMTADGQGNIGNVSVNGYTGSSATPVTQSLTGATYTFTNGAAAVKLGGTRNSSTLVAGDELLYISPDGNFIFGGNYSGYDMFVGVRAATSPPTNFDSLYYQAGLDLNESATFNSFVPLNSYYGAFDALPGEMIGHRNMSNVSPMRYQSQSALLVYGGTADFTYSDPYTLNSDGSSDDSDFSQHYLFSTDGTIRIGYGIGPYLSINVALQAPQVPTLSDSPVYLNPVGVVNAASSAPFTAQLAPGEFLTLYGSGLAPTTATASLPFPTLFNGVQVFINSLAAPIYYLSPTQISVIVPYTTNANSVADIYVANNGTNSNLVTQFTGLTAAGVFTNNPVGGLGYAAALHPDYSVISQSSPAQIGETVAVYLAGMGAVSPRVQDGMPASSNPLSYTTATPLVYLLDASGNYLQAPITFSGLAPGFAGLYQINFTIPSGLVSGNATIEIIGTDSATFQALLPLA